MIVGHVHLLPVRLLAILEYGGALILQKFFKLASSIGWARWIDGGKKKGLPKQAFLLGY